MFLTTEELRALTGYARAARQVAQLRRMGIPFWVNGCGKPIVARAAINGGPQVAAESKPQWEPTWAGSRAAT